MNQSHNQDADEKIWGILTRFDMHRQVGDMTLGEARREARLALNNLLLEAKKRSYNEGKSYGYSLGQLDRPPTKSNYPPDVILKGV